MELLIVTKADRIFLDAQFLLDYTTLFHQNIKRC